MSYIKKSDRIRVWQKYGGKCAYCGCNLLYKQMQVDHIRAHWHGMSEEQASRNKIEKGSHDLDNLNPSCRRCNKWKGTFSIEQFREQVALQVARLKRDSNQFRMALDYGLIVETKSPIVFWFERFHERYRNSEQREHLNHNIEWAESKQENGKEPNSDN